MILVKSREINTLVLISIELEIFRISFRNPEEIEQVLKDFLQKSLRITDLRDFNTLVLKSRILDEFENDRPVGRSFSGIWDLRETPILGVLIEKCSKC